VIVGVSDLNAARRYFARRGGTSRTELKKTRAANSLFRVSGDSASPSGRRVMGERISRLGRVGGVYSGTRDS